MADYIHDYSNFPSQPITLHNYKDVNDDVAFDIEQINKWRAEGLYNAAARYIADRPYLSDFMIGAETINTIIEEIYNTQILAKKNGQFIYFDNNQPSEVAEDDVWLGTEV